MEGIASRRLRRAINVVKNELRPKGSTCTTSLSPSTRDTAITSRPRLILFDRINQLDVIYHASLCFISSFVRSMLDCTIEYLHLGKKGLPSTILFSRVFRLNWRKTKERSSLHRIQSYRFIHSFPPTMDKALLSGQLHCLTEHCYNHKEGDGGSMNDNLLSNPYVISSNQNIPRLVTR